MRIPKKITTSTLRNLRPYTTLPFTGNIPARLRCACLALRSTRCAFGRLLENKIIYLFFTSLYTNIYIMLCHHHREVLGVTPPPPLLAVVVVSLPKLRCDDDTDHTLPPRSGGSWLATDHTATSLWPHACRMARLWPVNA